MIKHYYEQGMFEELDETFAKSQSHGGSTQSIWCDSSFVLGWRVSSRLQSIRNRNCQSEAAFNHAGPHQHSSHEGRRELRYSIVDEYDDHEFSLWTQFSQKPFSVKKLIEFLDNSSEVKGYPGSLTLAYNNSNADGVLSRERLRDFTTVCSEIYSQLEEHYDRVYADWIVEEHVVG